jgi:hypothetical protein
LFNNENAMPSASNLTTGVNVPSKSSKQTNLENNKYFYCRLEGHGRK